MELKRSFLVPIGVAAAALTAKAGAADLATPPKEPGLGDGLAIDPQLLDRVRQPLLAVPRSSYRTVAETASVRLTAKLTVRQVSTDPQVAGVGAKGTLTGTLKDRMFYWRLAFTHLSSGATSAELHRGRRGLNGARLARLCGACQPPETGLVVLTQTQVSDLLSGRTYVQVNTRTNPHGEIRGQIHRVAPLVTAPPEPPPSGGHISHMSHVSHASHSSHVSHSSHSSHVSGG